EACANTRVQLDSQPEIIDQLMRKKMQLEVEKTALEKEKDPASKERLQKVIQELQKLSDELTPLKLKYEAEMAQLNELRQMTKKLENLKIKLQNAERNRDLSLVADLRYGAIPDVEAR